VNLRLERQPADGDTLPGELFMDGARFSPSLERTSRAFPNGRYRVQFTVSTRATNGELWSPDPLHRLPLIVVPGRDGIRFHAANHAEELLGCVALGQGFAGPVLQSSRPVVTRFIDRVREVDANGDEIWLDVEFAAAPGEGTRTA
jgi:hypothetical protein